eukprot:178886-Prymnesium_polylepis.2
MLHSRCGCELAPRHAQCVRVCAALSACVRARVALVCRAARSAAAYSSPPSPSLGAPCRSRRWRPRRPSSARQTLSWLWARRCRCNKLSPHPPTHTHPQTLTPRTRRCRLSEPPPKPAPTPMPTPMPTPHPHPQPSPSSLTPKPSPYALALSLIHI